MKDDTLSKEKKAELGNRNSMMAEKLVFCINLQENTSEKRNLDSSS